MAGERTLWARTRSPGKTGRTALSAALLLRCLGIVLLIAMPFLLGWLIRTFYFSRNPHFTLRQIVVQTGETVSEASLLEIMGLETGMNLFAIDLGAKRRTFLQNAHHVRNLQIKRILPDRLEIRVTERRPVARIGRRGNLVVDEQGLVFVRRGDLDLLPSLVGGRRAQSGSVLVVAEEPIPIEPGTRLSGNALAGVAAIVLNEDPGFNLPVLEVDVSPLDYITLYLADRSEVRLAWDGMGGTSRRSREHLRHRFNQAMYGLAQTATAGYRLIDVTVDDSHVHAYGR